MRTVLAVFAGFIAAILCVAGIETLGHLVFPPPPGFDASDPANAARLMEMVPIAALLFVVGGWFVGALTGAWVANAIAGKAPAGWSVAVLVVAGGVVTMVMIPHPAWMWAAGILLPLLAAWLAQRLTQLRT
jgi:hypothetical protein